VAVTVKRWGNSLGLRISKGLAQGAHLREGSTVDVRLERGRLVVVPVKPKKTYTLAELVARITPENIPENISTGRPVGKEVW